MKKGLLFSLMCLLFCCTQLWAQTKTITGKVTDESGTPIEGATVSVKGTPGGTVSSTDGTFTLSVNQSVSTLIVSSIGYADQEVTLGSSKSVLVRLKKSEGELDEVVVVGYQTLYKRNLTGAVSNVKGEELYNRPVFSMDQALTGKAAGLNINTSSGLIGDNVIMRIRGAASISSGSQPLIVLDGVPILQGNAGQLYNPANALTDINPNDIESVEVLKDASAAALYGSRASGGVLLITTKKGRAGKTRLNYDNYFGFSRPARMMEVLDGEEYNTVINKMRSNAGLSNIAAYGDIDGDGQADVTNTDWQEEVYRNGFAQNHQISINGGTDKTTYYGSLNYNDISNYIIVNRQTRASARINLSTKLNDWLEMGVRTQYSRTRLYGLGSGTGGALSGVPFGPLTAYPNVPVYDTEGKYYTLAGGNSPLNNTPNPVAVQQLNFDTRDSRRYIASGYAEAKLLKGLKLRSQISIDYQTAFSDQYWDAEVGDGSSLAGLAQNVYDETQIWAWTNTINYNRRIGAHDLSLLAGSEYTRRKSLYNYTYGYELNDPLLRLIDPSNYGTVGVNALVTSDNGLASYFGGVNYGFSNKYLASFNFRADAYSGFGKDNRWGYFPSGSVGWRLSEEEFMKGISFIRDLKLRASYGITGNSNIGSFPSLATFAPTSYADIPSLNLNNAGNSALKWERTGQLDIGFDATIGKNISITADYYKRKTKDLILNNPILATIGFPGNTITQNIGKIENEGVELTVNLPLINRKDFTWDINFNGAWSLNRVVSTNENGDDIYGGVSVVRPGENMSAFYLIRWAGVNPANGLPTFLSADGVRKQYDHSRPIANERWTLVSDGSITSAITAADRVVHNDKTPYPKFFGGLSSQFRFGNFDASFDLQYALGFYVYNNTKVTMMAYSTNRNKSNDILDAWEKPGQQTDVPKLYWGDNQWSQQSTRWAEKGDFVRLRNLQIGYSVPKKLLGKIKIESARFFLQAQNAFTLTGYTGIDPEANANGNVTIGAGVDTFRPYLPRTITAGINIGL